MSFNWEDFIVSWFLVQVFVLCIWALVKYVIGFTISTDSLIFGAVIGGAFMYNRRVNGQ